MKYIAILLFLLATSSHANYQGKLDIGSSDPSALGMRDLANGVWRVGLQYPIWHLQNMTSGNQVFHVDGYWAARLEGQNPIYGPAVGVNIGPAVSAAVAKLELLLPVISNMGYAIPPFVAKLGDLASVDFYGGYAPVVGGGDKPWAYGVGGKVKIPITGNLTALYDWATGTQAQGTGVKGL